jgi:signal transduction histidine kinase
LTSISLALGNLQAEAKLKPEEVSQTITETRALIENSIEQVHQFASDLRPTVLDDVGLIPALHTYMENFTKRTGIQTHLTVSEDVESLSESYRTGIFRVTQEALANVARHAQASQALVDIHKEAKSVSLKIEDDGQSFEVLDGIRANGNESLGLLGMRERVEMIGGHFQIESGADKGTTILAHIPLENTA